MLYEVITKGNNGGDGFAMARHLVNRGAEVDVLTLGPDSASQGDAKVNWAKRSLIWPMLNGMVSHGVMVTGNEYRVPNRPC